MLDKTWSIEDSINEYQINRWGEGHFGINKEGELCVYPTKDPEGPMINIIEVVQEMKKEGVEFPAVIRFHDILRHQVKILNETFAHTIEEANYSGKYFGVFPIKVNQLREVVEEIVDIGESYRYGLEAGSKPEILAALAYNKNEGALTILNGYKDKEFMELALLGRTLGRKVIVVIEKLSELELLTQAAEEMDVEPIIGLRAKLSTKSGGKWAESSGEFAKFGLTAPEIISIVQTLKAKNRLHWLKLFHFHVGSQIPDIRSIKECITEGARFYSDLVKMGVSLEYFDVGGGVGINYDGSRSNTASSTNYSLKDYVGDVVYILKNICKEAGVNEPNIVTESGRLVTAHHSCVVTNVFGKISMVQKLDVNYEVKDSDPLPVRSMNNLLKELDHSNYQDVYNDACILKDETLSGFKLGVISLEQRAYIEQAYSHLCHLIMEMTEKQKYVPIEIKKLKYIFADKYLSNFSVFQSAPDTWAIGQILPIIPLTRLNERPNNSCTIADITCDSDGKINCFLGPDGHTQTMAIHDLKAGEEYTIGMFLTGAYQDIMGDMHNLFGRLNEVHVYFDDEDPQDFYIEEIVKGNSASDVLKIMQYMPSEMCREIKNNIDKKVKEGVLRPRQGVKLTDFYENALNKYTYLDN